jgi:hypothetical protein
MITGRPGRDAWDIYIGLDLGASGLRKRKWPSWVR